MEIEPVSDREYIERLQTMIDAYAKTLGETSFKKNHLLLNIIRSSARNHLNNETIHIHDVTKRKDGTWGCPCGHREEW